MNSTFEKSPQEIEILGLTRYAHEHSLKIESIHGPALSNGGISLKQLYGYEYRANASKRIYLVCL